MTWQGGAVLALLILSIITSKVIKSHPRDLIFAVAALLTPLLGIVSSPQICHAFANRITLSVVILWIIIAALRERRFFPSANTFREKFPLPLLLEIFSAYLFYFAIKNTALDQWSAFILPHWITLSSLFLASQALPFFMPRPIAFAILFAIASPLFPEPFLPIATIALSLLLNLIILHRSHIPWAFWRAR